MTPVAPSRVICAEREKTAEKTRSMIRMYGGVPRAAPSEELAREPSARRTQTWRATGSRNRAAVSRQSVTSNKRRVGAVASPAPTPAFDDAIRPRRFTLHTARCDKVPL